MDLDGAVGDLLAMKRELRRMRFRVSGEMKGVVAMMERLVDKLLKRAVKAAPKPIR